MSMGVLLVLATIVAGESSVPAVVTERAFLDAALRDNRVRAVADEPLQLARADRARAQSLDNPEGSFDREAPQGAARQDSWSISWAPPLDGRNLAQARAGRAGLRAAESRHELALTELRAELREAYAAWALAREGWAISQRLTALIDRLAASAQAQASRGEASVLASRRLQLAQVEVHAQAARLSAELAHSRGRVRAWLPNLESIAVPARPPLPPAPGDTSLWSRSP
ncbi:MAG: TolC family protein, partial [Candidatus Eisenbacteria bacterium]|nr:TolC family protein [Candidatus Eisenbacteria bacterium]